MHSYLPAVPYPPSADGYWTPVTSTINWCEEDYYATTYCAEIINSFTNLAFVYLAYRGIASCIRNNHDTVFLVGFVSYLVIGLGSFVFHTTLKYSTQLLDELAMIYTTCIMFYSIFSHGLPTRQKLLIFLGISALATFITLYYHYLKDPAFHQNAFTLLTTVVFLRSVWAMETALRPRFRRAREVGSEVAKAGKGESTGKAREKEQRDAKILGTMWQLNLLGLSSVAFAFLLWNIDNEFCSTLRSWRRQVGLPWGVLLEGHGWWHVFTGIAQYCNLTWSVWLRYVVDGRQDEVELVWEGWRGVMSVEKVRRGGVKAEGRKGRRGGGGGGGSKEL